MRKIIRSPNILNDSNNESEFIKLKKELQEIRSNERKEFYNKRSNSKRLSKRRKYINQLKLDRKLAKRAKNLEDCLPRSEIWFRKLYNNENMARIFKEDLWVDKFNEPFNRTYIPDVSNRGYKYIIEVDGSIHNRADIKIKDAKKDYYFLKRGYLVIRINAYDETSYNEGMDKLRTHINMINEQEMKRRNNK